jgi:hypothetical protein
MIKTALPYNIEEMEQIQKDGALVNMSDLNFINIPREQQKKTSLVFLKNTGFNVTLDFSSCSFEEKEEFLKLYLTEDISVSNHEFPSTWVKILNYAIGNRVDMPSIMDDDEIDKFMEINKDFLTDVFQLIISLPVYAMFRFILNDAAYDLSEFKKTDKNMVKCNLYHLLDYDEFLYLYSFNSDIEPLFYTEIFTLKNNELFDAIQKLPFMDVLYGLSTSPQNEWKGMVQEVERFDEQCR